MIVGEKQVNGFHSACWLKKVTNGIDTATPPCFYKNYRSQKMDDNTQFLLSI